MPWLAKALGLWCLCAWAVLVFLVHGLDVWFRASIAVNSWWGRWQRRRHPLESRSFDELGDPLVHGAFTGYTSGLPTQPLWYACGAFAKKPARTYGSPITCLTCSALLSQHGAPK
jgi:hypothetical protein